MPSTKKTAKAGTQKTKQPSTPTRQKPQRGIAIGVRMLAPQMWRFEWERRELAQDCEDEDTLPLSLGLGLSRTAQDQLMVELSVDVNTQQARFLVAYRSEWVIEDFVLFPDTEGTLRTLAAQIGPAALYPFIRETVTSASIKAGLPPIVLPIINFGDFFSVEEIRVPAWDEKE